MSILLADIDATCAALGYSDGQKYQAEPDAAEGLKHLIWILRRDLDNHEYRRHLGRSKVLQTDLVYMLPDYVHHEELSDLLIRLLVILTNPTLLLYREGAPKDNHGRKVFMELIEILQGYKAAFAKDKVWSALFEKLKQALEIHIKNKIMNSEEKRNPNYSGEEEDSWMNSYYVCLVCMQTAESPRVSFCGHHFCAKCIYNWIRRQKYQAKCPYCQSLIGENTLITIRHAKTKKNVLSCKSFGEHRRKMRMSNDCLSENILLPEAGMFTRGYIKYPPDPMPRIKPLPPQLLQQWSRYPIVRIFLTPSLHQRFINFAIFLFMLTMYLHAAVTPDLLEWPSEV